MARHSIYILCIVQQPNLMNLSCVAEPPTAGSNLNFPIQSKRFRNDLNQ